MYFFNLYYYKKILNNVYNFTTINEKVEKL